MQEHLNNLILAAGVDQADIDSIIALEAAPEGAKPEDLLKIQTLVDTVLGKLTTNVETKVKNDQKFWDSLDENNVNETFKKKIEAQQYGRAANIVRQKALKALGLKEEDFADMPEEEKKQLETFITKAGEKFASTKAGDKQMQADLLEARKKLEDLELSIPEKEGKVKEGLETRFNNEKLDFIILAALAGFEGLKAPAQYLVGKIAAELKAENAFVFDGLNAKPMQKDKPTLEIVEGTKVLNLRDLIEKKLTKDGLISDLKPDFKKKVGTTTTVETQEDGGLAISGHVLEMIEKNK